MTSIKHAVALIVCCVLLGSGCSDRDRAAEAGSGTATPTATGEPADLPDGMQWVESGIGLRFAAPAHHHVIWAHIEAFDSPLGASTIAYHPYRIHGKWSFTAALYLPLDEGSAFMFVVSPRYDELTALVAEMIPTLGQVDVSR